MRFLLILSLFFFTSSTHAGDELQERYDRFATGLQKVVNGKELLKKVEQLEKLTAENKNIFIGIELVWDFWRNLYTELPEDEATELVAEAFDYCERQFSSYCEHPSHFQPRWLAQENRGIAEALIKLQQQAPLCSSL